MAYHGDLGNIAEGCCASVMHSVLPRCRLALWPNRAGLSQTGLRVIASNVRLRQHFAKRRCTCLVVVEYGRRSLQSFARSW